MADTVIHGYRGMVSWTTEITTQVITGWTVNLAADIHDISGVSAASVARTKIAGLQDWTATVEALGDSGAVAMVEGATATLELSLTRTVADGSLTGTAFCSGLSVTQAQSDAGKITYTFQGSGALTWAVV